MSFDLLNETAQDAAVAKIATGASISGGLTAFWGGASLNEVAMCVGMLVAVLGFIVQLVVQGHLWLCRLKTQRRESILFRARMKKAKDPSDKLPTDFDEL